MVDVNIVAALMALAFISENGCKRAAFAVNNTSAELAATWLFDNMERTEIHEPLIYSDTEESKYEIVNDNFGMFLGDEQDSKEMNVAEDMTLSEIELKQIEDIPEYGLKADTYYKHMLWDEAKIYYSNAIKQALKQKNKLIYKQSKDRDINDKIYKWYAFRRVLE